MHFPSGVFMRESQDTSTWPSSQSERPMLHPIDGVFHVGFVFSA